MTCEVAILIADGVTDSALAVTLDVLRAASSIAVRAGRIAAFRTSVVSPPAAGCARRRARP